MIGILQFSLIKPYYRNNKINNIKEISTSIENALLNDDYVTQQDLNKITKINLDNNICTIIYNDRGDILYNADSLGDGCIFNQNIVINDVSFNPLRSGLEFKNILGDSDSLNINITNNKSNQEMIIYGSKIKYNLSNLYLYINSPLEPVDSILVFFREQYLIYTIIVIILSSIVSIFISNKISKPIVNMNKSAKILAKGNYNISFNDSYFSETSELSRTLNEATYKLSKVDELRKDLIANVSHDIKTPLTMIKAYAEMIKDISGDNKVKREEHLNVILDEVDYLDKLVFDMNFLSKVQSGNYELNLNNFDIASKIREIVNLNRVTLTNNEINIILNVPDELIIFADETKMGQVIYNFLSNAIKHSEKGSNIYINVLRNDEYIRVEIIDEGEGIDEQDLPYIWDRYYKVDKQFTRNHENTGLGLAIVKAILDTHKARYGVESQKNKGSKFYFELDQVDIL